MNTSRKKYRRSLQVSGIIRLVLLGGISAGVAGAFVVVKNRQHSLANSKVAMECEIVHLHKTIEAAEQRIAAMVDRKVLEKRISDDLGGRGLVEIEYAETLRPAEQGVEQGVEQYASYKGRPGTEDY